MIRVMTIVIFISTTISVFAAPLQDAPAIRVARVLELLIPYGQLYNCSLEVVKRADEQTISYMVWLKDRSRPEVGFEIVLPAAAGESISLQESSSLPVKYSFGYEAKGVLYRTFIKVELDAEKRPTFLTAGQINLASGITEARVDCHSKPFGY